MEISLALILLALLLLLRFYFLSSWILWEIEDNTEGLNSKYLKNHESSTVSKGPDLSEHFDCASNYKSHFSSLCLGGSKEEKRTSFRESHLCITTTECAWALPNYFTHLLNLNLNHWLNVLKLPIKTHAISKNFVHINAYNIETIF